MAFTNILTRNPMVIGATMLSSYKAAVASTLGSPITLRIEKLYWERAVSLGDFLRIFDPQSGNMLQEIYNVAAGTSYWVDWTASPKLWQDFIVSQIDSGLLYVYTR